jgi:hypothetical protein
MSNNWHMVRCIAMMTFALGILHRMRAFNWLGPKRMSVHDSSVKRCWFLLIAHLCTEFPAAGQLQHITSQRFMPLDLEMSASSSKFFCHSSSTSWAGWKRWITTMLKLTTRLQISYTTLKFLLQRINCTKFRSSSVRLYRLGTVCGVK